MDPAFGHTNVRVAQIYKIYQATQIVLYNCTAPDNIYHWLSYYQGAAEPINLLFPMIFLILQLGSCTASLA